MQEWEICLRLVLSCIMGGIIGYERQMRHKSAGLRTNMLVSLGSCLIMIMSEALYDNVEGKTNADPARLAAQVVSGIGFLGAGAIMKEGLTVTGLTTAIVFLILGNLSRLDAWVDHDHMLSLSIPTVDRPGQIMRISACIEDLHLRSRGVKVHTDEDEAPQAGERRIYVSFEVFNTENIKPAFIVDALRQVDGVLRVDVA